MSPKFLTQFTRRGFLEASAGTVLTSLGSSFCARPGAGPAWNNLRFIHELEPGSIIRNALDDVAVLLERGGIPKPLRVRENGAWTADDVVVASSLESAVLPPEWRCLTDRPGAFRLLVPRKGPSLIITGADAEVTRNGLYAWLELNGFAFFRDGERIPRISSERSVAPIEEEVSPDFRWRGDMIWDNYLGPSRYCAATWGIAEWEQALLFMARNGLNFLEFYLPLEGVFLRTFPEATTLKDGVLWKTEYKEKLTQYVLSRGRDLGIQFMYVLTYGAFPEPIRALFPQLEWANGFLCGHQTELETFTRKVWSNVVKTFGTDSLYAIRHRGEEGQSYSDPCRSITKSDGFNQSIKLLQAVDPNARVTVWTWGETLPDLFADLPSNVKATHIRHGMSGLFTDRGVGVEQADGKPNLPSGQRWLAGQFTVFGGNETLLQTAWSDAESLASDARAAVVDSTCEGYFQWPEWSNTSPWVSHVICSLAWKPMTFRGDSELQRYARLRHGEQAEGFLAAFAPLLSAGNAKFVATPRKRLLVPYFLSRAERELLVSVANGLQVMSQELSRAPDSRLFQRDMLDVLSWTAVRQAQVFEVAAYQAFREGKEADLVMAIDSAKMTWSILRTVLAQAPELSIIETARAAVKAGPISKNALNSFWTLGCDFYNGYPLVLCPEAIELVYLDQSGKLGQRLLAAVEDNNTEPLEKPGWFWHNFSDSTWGDTVRVLPREDAFHFEISMRSQLAEVLSTPEPPKKFALPKEGELVSPSSPSVIDNTVLRQAVEELGRMTIPDALESPTF